MCVDDSEFRPEQPPVEPVTDELDNQVISSQVSENSVLSELTNISADTEEVEEKRKQIGDEFYRESEPGQETVVQLTGSIIAVTSDSKTPSSESDSSNSPPPLQPSPPPTTDHHPPGPPSPEHPAEQSLYTASIAISASVEPVEHGHISNIFQEDLSSAGHQALVRAEQPRGK